MSDETPQPESSGRQLQLLGAVVLALVLGFVAGRLSVAPPSGPPGLEPIRRPARDGSPVVAEVAGSILTLDQLRARWEQLPADARRFHAQRGGIEHFLDEVAEELLLSEESILRGYADRANVREAIRQEVNRELIAPLLAAEVRAKAIPERELQARFELRRDEWARPARVRIREIRVTPTAEPESRALPDDATSPEEAEAKARSLHERLQGGESFEAVAQAHSEAPSALYGGLIGWVVEGRLALEYEEAALALAPGQMSEPLEMSDSTWVILQAEAREEAGTVDFEEHREEILGDLLKEDPGAVSRRYRVFVEELKRSHDYRVDPEAVREAFESAATG